MLIESRKQRLYASHHQFYVEDQEYPGDTGDPNFWTEDAFKDLLAISEGTIGIGTGTYGSVDVTTEIHDSKPPLDLEVWDHVTEASLMLKSGTLQVIGCLEETGETFQVQSGSYCVRCCHANLDQSDEFGEGSDWYLVQLWPCAIALALAGQLPPPRVLKRWAGYST
ncbi:MAG TPA: hypothetical protein V6D29_11355 [Leptolyngbyaceae cyanobacterium]